MDLADVGPGFSDPVAMSQSVFRAGLHALARPGKPVRIASDATAPQGVEPAACALLLSLLDQDTVLFVSPSHGHAVAAYFRFHTGCMLTETAPEADFLYFGAQDAWPDLSTLNLGSEYAPDRSATLVREVTSLTPEAAQNSVRLSGPGIPDRAAISADQLDAAFIAQWRSLRGLFPRGVDLFVTCGHDLCGLPRTTQIEVTSCT